MLVVTFQHETHARITQAHIDAKTNKIVIRQSRQLVLGGAEGQPPPDAYIVLRWLLNSPIGQTKYEDKDLPGTDEGENGARAGGAPMPVVPKIVVKSG